MDGDHSLERSRFVTEWALREVFYQLGCYRVDLEGILLKPSMVIPGKDAAQKATVAQVATETVNTLRRTVPPAVPGIVFLSGGQSEVLATQHLDAMNRLGPSPWPLSFSFGRALQESALKIWAGKSNMVSAGQEALHYRAECNSLARNGAYIGEAQRGADQGATH